MTYLYLLFFLTLNLFIYIYLNKVLILKPFILFSVILLFITLIFLHELKLINILMNSSKFNHILFFSYSLIFWFFLNKFLSSQIDKKKQYNVSNKLICSIIQKNILINFIFITCSITQIQMIIK